MKSSSIPSCHHAKEGFTWLMKCSFSFAFKSHVVTFLKNLNFFLTVSNPFRSIINLSWSLQTIISTFPKVEVRMKQYLRPVQRHLFQTRIAQMTVQKRSEESLYDS